MDYITTKYNGFTNNPESVKQEQTGLLSLPGTSNYNVIDEGNVFDAAGRLVTKTYSLNNSVRRQAFNYQYNSLGQLIEKNIGEEEGVLQSVDYTYNIRGWLNKINDASLSGEENDFFGEEIFYDESSGLSNSVSRYDGTIAAIKWQTVGVSGQKGYTFRYDGLNRMTHAIFSQKIGSEWEDNDRYNELVNYDLNGNITSLMRRGLLLPNNTPGVIDHLSYYLAGNRLIGVNDQVNVNNRGDFFDNGHVSIPDPNDESTWEMKYDRNGNLKSDVNKLITSITYNIYNQPVTIDFSGGSRIVYLYDGAGNRLKKTVIKFETNLTKTTEYVSNFVYEDNLLVYVMNGEGRYVFEKENAFAEFYLKDHLGNVRVAFRRNDKSGTAELREVNAYYPYGMNIRGLSGVYNTFRPNEFFYQGKEMDDELGLNWLDFHARMYDPVLGRWNVLDPAQQNISGYMAMGDNPVSNIDPDGRQFTGWNEYWTAFHAAIGKIVSEARWAQEHEWDVAYDRNSDFLFGDPEDIFSYSSPGDQKGLAHGEEIWCYAGDVLISKDRLEYYRENGGRFKDFQEAANIASAISAVFHEEIIVTVVLYQTNIKGAEFRFELSILEPSDKIYDKSYVSYDLGHPGYYHGDKILAIHHWFTSYYADYHDSGGGGQTDSETARFQNCPVIQHNNNRETYKFDSSGKPIPRYWEKDGFWYP